MLDENLPAFFLKPSSDGIKHHRHFFLSHHGSDPAPAYNLQHADPTSPSPAHKNCYAAALFDAYNPEVLFGEVLARPTWTQPTLSQDELRKHAGTPPPPQPVLPAEFTVQLYNPDQQIRVALKEGKWGGSDSYEFSMPMSTFRTPSASTLDRGQSDPASLAITPKVHFVWRKESKLSKDLTCFMTGKSTDALHDKKKKGRRDPDIAIALWRSMRELTVYEPNLSRLDMEDPKGLEVVLLLSAVVIKDLYLGGKEHVKEIFNISGLPEERKLSGGGRKLSNPQKTQSIVGTPNALSSHPVPPSQQPQQHPFATQDGRKPNSLPRLQTTPPRALSAKPTGPPPLADPRAQWELDAETARLRAQADAEAREEHRRRRDREKADEAEAKRLQKAMEEEERQSRKKQADVDRETERLKKKFGVPPVPARSAQQQQPNSSSFRQHHRPPQPGSYLQPIPQRTQLNLSSSSSSSQPRPNVMGSNGLYIQPAASASAVVMSGANPSAGSSSSSRPLDAGGQQQQQGYQRPAKKKSFFGLRSASDENGAAQGQRRLAKKSSAMW